MQKLTKELAEKIAAYSLRDDVIVDADEYLISYNFTVRVEEDRCTILYRRKGFWRFLEYLLLRFFGATRPLTLIYYRDEVDIYEQDWGMRVRFSYLEEKTLQQQTLAFNLRKRKNRN